MIPFQIRTDYDDTAIIARPMRFDRGTIKGKTSRTAEGYLRADAVVTRCGVFTYKNPDGSLRRELRHPDDVFKQVSLDSLKMIPLTNEHPEVKLLTAETAKKFQVGFSGENVRRDGDDVMTPVIATDAATISDIDNGKKELSCGYTLDLIRQDGVYEGQKYNCRQTNIVYNHIAITTTGRAGSARFNLDAEDAFEMEENELQTGNDKNKNNNTSQRRNNMVKYRIDSVEYDADAQVVLHATKMENTLKETKTNLDAVTKENDTLKAANSAVTAERDTLKVRLDAAEARETKVAHEALVNQAKGILGKDVNLDNSTDEQIKKMVVEKAFPTLKDKLVNCDSGYLAASYDNATAVLTTVNATTNQDSNNASSQRAAVFGNGTRADSKTDSVDAKAEYEKRLIEGWKKK